MRLAAPDKTYNAPTAQKIAYAPRGATCDCQPTATTRPDISASIWAGA
jgi:hypothetical protein